MSPMMDLVAGDRREIVLVLAVDDVDALADVERFPAHLAFGAGLDPTWLDLFSEAVRAVTGLADPVDFLDARLELRDAAAGERTVERVDPSWTLAVAALSSADLDAIAARWLDLIAEEQGGLAADERSWLRELTGRIVAFARAAEPAADVVFAWSVT